MPTPDNSALSDLESAFNSSPFMEVSASPLLGALPLSPASERSVFSSTLGIYEEKADSSPWPASSPALVPHEMEATPKLASPFKNIFRLLEFAVEGSVSSPRNWFVGPSVFTTRPSPQLTEIYDHNYPSTPRSDPFPETRSAPIPDTGKTIVPVKHLNFQDYFFQTESFIQLRLYNEAATAAAKALELCPQNAPEKSLLLQWSAKSKLMLKDYKGSIQDAEGCLHIDPNDYYAYLTRVEASYYARDWNLTIKFATEAINKTFELDLDYAQISSLYHMRIKAHYETTNYHRVITEARQILELEPNSADAQEFILNAKAKITERAHKFLLQNPILAIPDLNFLINLGDTAFYKNLALIYFQIGNFRAAIAYAHHAFNFYLNIDEKIKLYTCRAQSFLNVGEPRKAILDIVQLLNLVKDNKTKKLFFNALLTLENKAAINFTAGNIQEAFDDYSVLIEHSTDPIANEISYYYRAQLSMELSNHAQARDDANRVIHSADFSKQFKKPQIIMLAIRSLANAILDEIDEAENDVQAIFQLDPNYYSINIIHAVIEFKRGNFTACETYAVAAIESYHEPHCLTPNKDLIFTYQLLYQAYLQLSRPDDALVVSRKLLQLAPNNENKNLEAAAKKIIQQEQLQKVQQLLMESAFQRNNNDAKSSLVKSSTAIRIAKHFGLDKNILISSQIECAYSQAANNDYRNAIENITQAINLGPSDTEQLHAFFSMRADFRQTDGDLQGYFEDKETALKLSSSKQDTIIHYLDLIKVCQQQDIFLAKKYIINLLALEPNNLDYLRLFLLLNIELKDFTEANACMIRINAIANSHTILDEFSVPVDIAAGRYDLCLISDLPENNPEKAEKNKLYLDSNGNYVVIDPQGRIIQDSLNGEAIDFSGLMGNLTDSKYRQQIFAITSKRGHTPTRFVTVKPFSFHNTTYAAAVHFHVPGQPTPSPLIFPKTIEEIATLNKVIKQRNQATVNELFGLLTSEKSSSEFRHNMLNTRIYIEGVGEANIIMAMFLLGDDRQKNDLIHFIEGIDPTSQTLALGITLDKRFYGYSLPMIIAHIPSLHEPLLTWIRTGTLSHDAFKAELVLAEDPQHLTLLERILSCNNKIAHTFECLKFISNANIDPRIIINAYTRKIENFGTLVTMMLAKSYGIRDISRTIFRHDTVTQLDNGQNIIGSFLEFFSRNQVKHFFVGHVEKLFNLLTAKDTYQLTFAMYVLKNGSLQQVLQLLNILDDDSIKRIFKENPLHQQRLQHDFLQAKVGETEQTVLNLLELRLQESDDKEQLLASLDRWKGEVFTPVLQPNPPEVDRSLHLK